MDKDYYKKIFSKNLKRLMEINDKTQADLIRDLNITRSAISTWVNGTRLPRMDKVDLLAQYFHASRSDLIEDKESEIDNLISKFGNIHHVRKRSFPMLGTVACGKPIMADQQYDSFILADADIDADYCLTASGDSMINARIFDGDIVFVKKQDMVDNGDIAVVIIDDDVTLKRVFYYPETQTLRLQAENPQYKPFVFTGEELEHVHILGKAVFFQSMVR